MTCFWGTFNVIFFEGFIAPFFTKLGVASDQVGYLFGSNAFFYLVGCLLLPYTFESSPRKLQFVVSFLLMSVCMLLMGGSEIFEIPQTYFLTALGFIMLGIPQVPVFI